LYKYFPFLTGHIERRFVDVPFGASWAEVTMRTSAFDTPRRFFLDTVQVLLHKLSWFLFLDAISNIKYVRSVH